jgi:uncharacterized protein YecE (DUF72 family)
MSRFLVGTSGFSYGHWAEGVFYPAGVCPERYLEHYATRFDAVEIDSTFYRLPAESVVDGWARRTPPGFRFALKGSRYVTHVRKLTECSEAVARLMSRGRRLRGKFEVVLWQLADTHEADANALRDFCDLLTGEAHDVRHVFELRHPSWMTEQIYGILAHHGHGLCFGDSSWWPPSERVTADFVYVRLHSGREGPGSAYSNAELEDWSARIGGWLGEGLDVYAFFNNDEAGYAPRDAKTLADLVFERSLPGTGAGHVAAR